MARSLRSGGTSAGASWLLGAGIALAAGACDVLSGFDDLAFDLPPPVSVGGSGGEGGASGLCTADDDCDSGHCADGVCCDTACEGACVACNLVGMEGVCSPHPAATAPEPSCAGLCDGAGTCAEGTVLWSRQLGAVEADAVNDVDIDRDGNILLVGVFSGDVDFGDQTLQGSADAFVLKTDGAGKTLFSLRAESSDQVELHGVAADPDGNIVVVGEFTGTVLVSGESATAGGRDILVFKLAPDGELVWFRSFGVTFDEVALTVATDDDGNIVFGGNFNGNLDFGAGNLPRRGNADAFVAMFDAAGNHLWSRSAGVNGYDSVLALSVVGNAEAATVFLGGTFQNEIDFGSGALNGGDALDGFVARLDELGTAAWQVGLIGGGEQRVTAVAPAAQGVLVGGVQEQEALLVDSQLTSAGGRDVWAARLDDVGAVVWSARFGAPTHEALGGLGVDKAGNMVLAGTFVDGIDFGAEMLAGAGGNDVFVAKLTSSGEQLWSQRFGFANDQEVKAMAVDEDGAIVVVGDFRDSIRFDEQRTSAGETDIFLIKLAP